MIFTQYDAADHKDEREYQPQGVLFETSFVQSVEIPLRSRKFFD
jgi:hypothetical protein